MAFIWKTGEKIPFGKNAILACGLVILLISAGCSTTASGQGGGVVISEVVSSNSNSLIDPELGTPDWIELCNTSKSPVNLLDYSLIESRNNKFVLPEITIKPGEYILLYCCTPTEGVEYDNLCTGFKLAKSGSSLTLSSSHGIIQKLQVPGLETDISYGLGSNGDYGYFPLPTPGEANAAEPFDELSELESDSTALLRINEVMPENPSESDPYAWVEILNAGETAVELSDYYITENMSDPTKARLPEKLLGAGEYAVIRFTGNAGADETAFKISSRETSLAVSNNFGIVVDTFSWDVNILPGVSAGPNGDGDPVYFPAPTPGASNGTNFVESVDLAEGISDVRINEILLNNTFSIIDADGERSAWVELYNASRTAVSLSGYALSDSDGNLWKWSLPDMEIGPDSYAIVHLSGKDRISDSELHANFSVNNAEGTLFLTDLYHGIVQTVPLPSERKDNISYGFSAGGQWLFFPQPTPEAKNDTKGFEQIASIDTLPPGLKINEVVSVTTAKSGDPDWVELYNETSENINLFGYYLSDTSNYLNKWPLGDTDIKANGYAVIDEYQTEGGSANFSISMSGETLYLTNSDGNVVDEFNTGVMRTGLSAGLSADGGRVLYNSPTPGKQNEGDTLNGYCAAPVFSEGGGYRTDSFSLMMSTATPGGEIYYTLDGSTPTGKSSKYTGPITVSSTETVRAVTIAPGMLNSDESVATYLFEDKHSLPVVCLSITKSDLNYVFRSQNRDDRRERAGYVEYYEADGTLGVRFPAGFQISGAGTRGYSQKSINLYLRGGFGRSSVTYPFFDGYDITTFESLSLRNMGQDNSSTRIRDAYFHMVVNGMNIDNMQSKFAVVYINGEYYGLYEFKENQNEDYLASKYDIDPDTVVMIRGNTNPVDKGTSKDIRNLYALAKNNTANADIFAQYTERADSDYFMDYLIAQTYFCNSDMYNQKYAHTTDNIVKWRPVFYDLDWAFMSTSPKRSVLGSFFNSEGVPHGEVKSDGTREITDTALYYAFYKNKEWRDAFVKRYAEVLNTILTTENMLETFDAMVDSIKDEMPRTISRWHYPSSMSRWEKEISSLRKCIAGRRSYAISSLKSFFKLSDSEMEELFPNG